MKAAHLGFFYVTLGLACGPIQPPAAYGDPNQAGSQIRSSAATATLDERRVAVLNRFSKDVRAV
jgi:hypothetical protein